VYSLSSLFDQVPAIAITRQVKNMTTIFNTIEDDEAIRIVFVYLWGTDMGKDWFAPVT